MTDFVINTVIMSHENESISLVGNLQNKTNKDLQLVFKEVDLNKISPSLEKFKIDGILNGNLNILQKQNNYQPTANVDIQNLKINSTELGKLNLNISGDNTLEKFRVKASLENQNIESLALTGTIALTASKSILDIDANLNKFNLGILANIGGETITNIRGLASGNIKIEGDANDFDMNGRMYLDKAGLNIPYLGVNYGFADQSVVDVSKTKFLIRNATIFDQQFKTAGILKGFIQHKNFSDWKLDLNLESDNLLALDTKDSEDANFFGRAYILGDAAIKGPVGSLFINVNAKSNKGTDIKIPVSDAESVGDRKSVV